MLGFAVIGTACGGDGDASSSEKSSGAGEGAKNASDAKAGDNARAEVVDAQAPAEGRDITYTADLVVLVADAERASDQATAMVEEAGGYLAGQDAELQGNRESTLTLRIPASRFRPMLDDLGKLGTVQDKGIDSTDVTNEVVDLDSRLESQQASIDRLRSLLADAPTTSDVVAIEKELANREGEAESLQGQLRVLNDRVSLSTVTARFTEKAEAKPDNDDPGFLDALEAGTDILLNAGRFLLLVVGFLIPYLPLAILAWAGHRLWRRRHPGAARPTPPVWTPPTGRPPPPPPAGSNPEGTHPPFTSG